MKSPVDFWQNCPVCRARLGESSQCRRCGMDFSPILKAADEAHQMAGEALFQLNTERADDAFWKALRASQKHLSEETLKSLAIAVLIQRDFRLALTIWHKLKNRLSQEEVE